MTDEDSDQPSVGTDRCICGELLEEGDNGHWMADPGDHTPHVYHTDKEGIARHWEHIDGIDVTPETDPYPDGTIGASRSQEPAADHDGGGR